ncbi:MAG: hypothetical protein PVH88_17575 [Ignavibacteria bacterium]
MKEIINTSLNSNLVRLKKYLNYEISGAILYFLSFHVFIFIFLASAAALIFTPFMLYVLFKENKKGWIIFFGTVVILPVIIFIIISFLYEFGRPLLFISLGLFYFYCFMLRFEVIDWVKEMNARNQYLLNKMKSEEELKLFNRKE